MESEGGRMKNPSRIIRRTLVVFLLRPSSKMNLASAIQLFLVLFVSEFLMTKVAAFFSSWKSNKTDFQSSTKSTNGTVDFEDKAEDYRQRDKRKPHIIIILADDMGWNDVSFHGSDQIPTPNIDALAYNGIILNNHYVPAVCTPSRSALMTGKNPIRLGLQHSVILPTEPRGLPLSEKLLPEYLREAGYKTHAVGKWHLGYFKKEYTPTYRGFDTHFGYWNGLQDYYTHVTEEDPSFGIFKGFDMRRNLTVAWDTIRNYSTDLFTTEAIRLIKEHNTNEPMFLYLAHLAPHKGNPNQIIRAPDKEIAKFSYIVDPERRIQAAVVSKLDQSVGEVMEALKNRGLLKNSIVLFMSDNGAPTEGILSNHGSNYPLRGMKDSPWEGGIRGVAAIWSPLIKTQKRVSNQMMFMPDWLPTLLSAAGINKKQLRNIDGLDLWQDLVSNKVSSRSNILINIDDISNYTAIRKGNFKYVIGQTDTGSAWVGASGHPSEGISPVYDPSKVLLSKTGVAISDVITARQSIELNERRKRSIRNDHDAASKINFRENILTADNVLELRRKAQVECNVREEDRIPCDALKASCLFNIEKDPCEMVNLAASKPMILAIFSNILATYRSSVIPPSNMNGDSRANPSLWNNTWTCWEEPNPLALSYTDDEFQQYSGSAVAVMSIIFGLFVIGTMTLFASKYGKSARSGPGNNGDDYETIVQSASNNDEIFAMSKLRSSVRNSALERKETHDVALGDARGASLS